MSESDPHLFVDGRQVVVRVLYQVRAEADLMTLIVVFHRPAASVDQA